MQNLIRRKLLSRGGGRVQAARFLYPHTTGIPIPIHTVTSLTVVAHQSESASATSYSILDYEPSSHPDSQPILFCLTDPSLIGFMVESKTV